MSEERPGYLGNSKMHHQVIAEILEADLSPGDVIQLTVVSNSMKPLIAAGDQIIAEITYPDRIKRGDVIVIRRNTDFLTHRAIYKNRGSWITKGDNNTLPDTPIPTDKRIGRVIAIASETQAIDLQARKWTYLNPILGWLCTLEVKAFGLHPYCRLPFRWVRKTIQKLLI
jgi:signal peptidase I